MWRGVVLIVLCSVTFLTGLGRTAIQDSDEAYYAEAGREMVMSGDWMTPFYNFEPRLNKPILLYWLIGASYVIAGVGETAARFWPALSGVGVAMIAFLAGLRWLGRDVGLLAGVIVATSFGVVPFARQSLPDMPLAFFVSVSLWAAIEALAGDSGAARRPGWLYLAAIAAALGMLTKGPVAVVLPVTVLLPLLWWERRRLPRRSALPVTAGQIAVAAGLFTVVAAPWYAVVTITHGAEYLRQFFVGENVDRFATSQFNLWRGHQYVPIIIGGLLPWSVFGLFWLRPIADVMQRRRQLTAAERRLVCWAIGPLVFFMISIGSQPRYILPCLVPLAILLARSIVSRVTAPAPRRDWGLTVVTLLTGLVIVLAGLLILRAAPLLAAANATWSPTGPLGIAIGGCVVILSGLVGPRRWTPIVVASAAALAVVVFERSVLASGRPEPVEVLAATARAHGVTAPMCACGALARSLTFYTHVKTYLAATDRGDDDVVEFLASGQPVLAAVDSNVLARVEARLGRRFTRLTEVRYLSATARQQPGTLLSPDPGLLQQIVLVTNQ
jgi:4-amino-4-deoxy-L-arabinose transferase-like glycosyltransferase